ncbi:MAG: terminase small subunit [Kangiellaceae bacterium]|nr:terminase small subunit [Kangiellaceae bacterium]
MRSSNYLRQAKRRHNKTIVDESSVFTSNDKIVGKDTLASLMDVTITSIECWIRDGMPVEQRGSQLEDWIFNLNDVREWKSEDQ